MSFKLLTQNMWLTTTAKPPPFKKERVQDLLQHIAPFDIITLQEVFTFGDWGFIFDTSHKDTILQFAKKNGFAYYADSPAPYPFTQDSGLLILSKHKILSCNFHAFSASSLAEKINWKGVLHARIEVPIAAETSNTTTSSSSSSNNSLIVNVVTCHLDAHGDIVRQAQLAEIKAFLTKSIPNLSTELTILTGDFNICSLGAWTEGKPVEYQKALGILADFEDVFGQDLASHPVTYPAKKACIDHIFLSKNHKTIIAQPSWKVEKFQNKEGTRDVSDHYGVSLDVNVL